jgi:hypothetical protein
MTGLVLIGLALVSFADGAVWLPMTLFLVGAFQLLVQRN